MEAGETLDMPPEQAAPVLGADDGPALSPGATLGAYRVVSLLGEGGMGRVYLAEHSVIKRRVALKVLRRSLVDSQRSVERFFAEAEAVNRIHHPGIVEVTDLFLAEGTPCIVMEVLDGHTLASEIAKGAMLPARVVDIGRAIADALSATHAAGVVHRDLKPDNIVITGDGGVKILDFGVAKLLDTPATAAGQTAAGAILGTPEYMSPEQLAGKPVDARADIYTLGVTLYHAASGRVPFKGDSFGDFVVKHLTQEPPPLDDVPPGLARAIRAMLAKDPEARPATMRDVDALLADALAWRKRRSTRPIAIAAGIAVAALGAIGTWQLGVFAREPSGEGTRAAPIGDVAAEIDAQPSPSAAVVLSTNVPAAIVPATLAQEAPSTSTVLVDTNTASTSATSATNATNATNASAPATSSKAAKSDTSSATKARRARGAKADAPSKRGVIDPFGDGE